MLGWYTEFSALSPCFYFPAAAMRRANQPAHVFASSGPFLLSHPKGKGWGLLAGGPKTQHGTWSPHQGRGH